MNSKTSQEKALAAYREKQQHVTSLLSSIQNKLQNHGGNVVCWGHVSDLDRVEKLLTQLDTFLR